MQRTYVLRCLTCSQMLGTHLNFNSIAMIIFHKNAIKNWRKMGKNGEKWGKMGNLFYGESGKQIGKFPIFPHFSPLATPHCVSISRLILVFNWSYIQLYKCTKGTLVFNPKGC